MSTETGTLPVATGYDAATLVAHLRQGCGTECSVIAKLTDAIAAFVKLPRIPEPGLWGVVEADWDSRSDKGIPRAEWVRVKGNEWHSAISDLAVPWRELIAPVLIREGVES